jgi:hypothetical protein
MDWSWVILVELVWQRGRVQLVFMPAQGIGADIIPEIQEFVFAADNLFVIITLPDICGIQFSSCPACYNGLESGDTRRQ